MKIQFDIIYFSYKHLHLVLSFKLLKRAQQTQLADVSNSPF
jgi:hypothetical protein